MLYVYIMLFTCFNYFLLSYYNLWLMLLVGLFDRFLFPMLMVSSLCWITSKGVDC